MTIKIGSHSFELKPVDRTFWITLAFIAVLAIGLTVYDTYMLVTHQPLPDHDVPYALPLVLTAFLCVFLPLIRHSHGPIKPPGDG